MTATPGSFVINPDVEISTSELSFRFARSSGPGGQNVNKVETKVTLLFSVATSPSLSDRQRELILEQLDRRISRDGMLRVTSDRHRTRGANQREVINRFIALLQFALKEKKKRAKTRIPKRERRKRLENKRRHSRKKRLRGRPSADGD
jgi:ribosome-associated protein